MATEAKLKGNKKYLDKLDDIKIRVKKGQREIYKAYAESQGMSLNEWVISLMKKDMGTE